jgi:hypothetical protein
LEHDVRFSRTNLLLAACVAISLAGKGLANRQDPSPDMQLFQDRISSLMVAQGFSVRVEQRPLGPLIYGTNRACRVMAGEYSPYGTFADVFQARAASVGPLRFHYRGRTYSEAPKFGPLLRFYVQRELSRIGITVPRTPIVAVAASSRCQGSDLDWASLASLPG